MMTSMKMTLFYAGHIYAGGVFIALAQDYMIMRTDRGWFRLPEIQLKRSFSVGFLELAK